MISKCNEDYCPGWLGAMVIGIAMWVALTFMAIKDAHSEVIVSFERELPEKTFHFKRTFEDRDAFEMWLLTRLETEGCDPYLKHMLIEFKPTAEI